MPSIKDIVGNRNKVITGLKSKGYGGTDEELINMYSASHPEATDALKLPNISPLGSAGRNIAYGLTGGLSTKTLPDILGSQEQIEADIAVNPRASLAGDIGGSIIQTAGLMMLPGAREARAAQLLSKVPRLAKATGLTAETLPNVLNIARASTISGGARGAGTTEEGSDVGQYLENIGKGALSEGALGTAFGIPAASKTMRGLKAGAVGYGLGEGFIGEDSGTLTGGLAAAGSLIPASGSSYIPRALGALGRGMTSERGKGFMARLAGSNPEEFKKVASDAKTIDRLVKDIKEIPIGEKQAQLYDRITAIQNYNTNKLQEAELAIKTLKEEAKINRLTKIEGKTKEAASALKKFKEEAPIKRATELANKTKDVLGKIDNLFSQNKNLASRASASATKKVEDIYRQFPDIATQGDKLKVTNLVNDIDQRIKGLMIGGKKPSDIDARKTISYLKNIKSQLQGAKSKLNPPVEQAVQPSNLQRMLGMRPQAVERIEKVDKLPVEDYLKIKNDIANTLSGFKPGQEKVSISNKNLLEVKDLIDKTLKSNMEFIPDPVAKAEFQSASKTAVDLARVASVSGKRFSTPELAESSLKGLLKPDITGDLTTAQKTRISALGKTAKLAGQPDFTEDIMQLRALKNQPIDLTVPEYITSQIKLAKELKRQPLDVTIPNEIQSQLAEAQLAKGTLGTNPATVKSILEKISKPGEQFIPEKRSIPQIEALREKALAETKDPIFRTPLTEDIQNYQTRRFLESPTNRGSDISNALTYIGSTAGDMILGPVGRLAGSIFGRAAAKDVADRGSVVTLKATKWGLDKNQALKEHIAQNPNALKNYGQVYSESINKMSPNNFARFNFLLGSNSLGYRRSMGLAGDTPVDEEEK